MVTDTILVPLDYTGCASEVVVEAAQLAKKLGSTVKVLHVSNLPAGVPDSMAMYAGAGATAHVLDALDEDAREHIEPLMKNFELVGVDAHLVIEHGAVVDAILTAARKSGAGLIVMGTHGRTGLDRMLNGSIAEQVLRRSPVPVMTVRSLHPDAHPGESDVQAQVRAEMDG